MIRVTRGDLLAIRGEDAKFYYALILDKVGLFGGNWSFAFHKTSDNVLSSNDLLGPDIRGFHAFIDFIFAKRENRITRLATKINVCPYDRVEFLRASNAIPCRWCFIYNRAFQEVRRVELLNSEEKKYPIFERIDDTIMMQRVDSKWSPHKDV